MAINCHVVCLQYIYYRMTDGQIILRDIELPPQRDRPQCPLRAICT